MDNLQGCELCSFTTTVLKDYVEHYKLHSNVHNVSFPCGRPSCSRRLKSYEALKSHVSRDHKFIQKKPHGPVDRINLKCSLTSCSIILSDLPNLIGHIKEHMESDIKMAYPIVPCNRSYDKVSSFSSHLTRIHWDAMNTLKTAAIGEMYVIHEDAVTGPSDDTLHSITINEPMEDCSFESEVSNILNDYTLNTNFLKSMGLFYLKLESKNLIPSTVIQTICDEIQRLSNINSEIICERVKEKLVEFSVSESDIVQTVSNIKSNDFLSINNSEHFKTDYKRKHFYKTFF